MPAAKNESGNILLERTHAEIEKINKNKDAASRGSDAIDGSTGNYNGRRSS